MCNRLGICTVCREKAGAGSRMRALKRGRKALTCAKCYRAYREHCRELEGAARNARRARGECWQCTDKALKGKTLCMKHLKAQRKGAKAQREAAPGPTVLFLTQPAAGDKAKGRSGSQPAWKEMSAKAPGVKIATVSGDYTKGAWAGFVKFPAGSKFGVHTHSSDIKIVVVSGTFRYGDTPKTETDYVAGSYVFIPANLPHSNSQPKGALLYAEQADKFDNKPVQ